MARRRRSKFGAIRTEVDGIKFASRAEARYYQELRLRERAREISELTLQPVFKLEVINPATGEVISVGKYIGDFDYIDTTGQRVVADVKGFVTPLFRLKKKLVKALHGIDIHEVQA